jgi:hypothetical protein
MNLRFCCPFDGRKFSPVPSMTAATQVVRRTCAVCHRPWQLIVEPGKEVRPGVTLTKATLLEISRRVHVIE